MVGGILGILWPSDVAPGTLPEDELRRIENGRRADQLLEKVILVGPRTRRATPTPTATRSPGVVTQEVLKEIIIDRARLPTPTPTPTPTTTPQTKQAQTPQAKRALDIGLGLLPLLLPNVRRARSPTSTAQITPGIDPLTPVNPRAVPSPGASPFRQPPQNRYCESLKTKKRKKRKECKQRYNVAWTAGPSRGKIAGTKCLEFK